MPLRIVKAIPRYEMTLVVHDVQNTDFGEYECHVINPYGNEFVRLRLEKRSSIILECEIEIW